MLEIFNPRWWTMKAETRDLNQEIEKLQYTSKLDLIALDVAYIQTNNIDYNQKRLEDIKELMQILKVRTYTANKHSCIYAKMTFKLIDDQVIIEK